MTDQRTDQRFDLAIVGAGLSGSVLALAAGEAGLRAALIDRVPLKAMTDEIGRAHV